MIKKSKSTQENETQGAEIDLKSLTIEQKADLIVTNGYNAPRNRSYNTLRGLSNAELNYIIEQKCDDGSYQKAGEANAREITKMLFTTSNEIMKARGFNDNKTNIESVALAQCDNLATFFGGVQNRYISLVVWILSIVWHLLDSFYGKPFVKGLYEQFNKNRANTKNEAIKEALTQKESKK